jgi:4-alpha-glucanotransferase
MNPSGWLQPSYLDAFGRERRIAPDVLRRLEQLVGDEPPTGDLDAVAVLRPGEPLPTPGDLVLEDGTQLGPSSALPSDVPFGYHRLRAAKAGASATLPISAGWQPGRTGSAPGCSSSTR